VKNVCTARNVKLSLDGCEHDLTARNVYVTRTPDA